MKQKQILGILIVVAIVAIIFVKISSYNKYQYILDDIDELIEYSVENSGIKDTKLEGIDGFSPNKIQARKKESLMLVRAIAKEILKANRNESINADGIITEIYFGDYVIVHQGIVTLMKIWEKGLL